MDKKVTLAAHRGWRGKYPENTMLGFRMALTLDVDAVEMDVHMTKDYRIVVCHDASLNRTTDKTGMICKLKGLLQKFTWWMASGSVRVRLFFSLRLYFAPTSTRCPISCSIRISGL